MTQSKTRLQPAALCLLLLSFMNILSCSNSNPKAGHSAEISSENTFGYNLSVPDKTIILPHILHEISGITAIDSSSVACIQDENGIVFIFDLLKQKIKKQILFHANGDYEGITQVDDTIYILRSDGVLFEIPDFGFSDFTKKIFLPDLPANNYEGLCYDQKNHRLLIAPKDKSGNRSEFKEDRTIFGFDINTGMLIKEPVLKFDLSELNRIASGSKVSYTIKNKKKVPEGKSDISFRPSAIGIHPITNELYVLSATEHMLFVFDIYGTIRYMEKLNPQIFYQPEGITFLKNGDMLVSNEGQIKKPTLLMFNYKHD